MAQIYNTDLSKELIQGASIQVNRDLVPNQLAEKVVPVMEVNPKLLRRTNLSKYILGTLNSNTTIYTVPAKKKFIITGASISWVKDAACDVPTGVGPSIDVVLSGVSTKIIISSVTTLTAQSDNVQLAFPYPIEVPEGTTITGNRGGAFTAGNFTRQFTILGFEVENQIN